MKITSIVILCVAASIGLFLFSCKNSEIENDLSTSGKTTETAVDADNDEEKTIEFLKSEAEKYAKNTIRKVGKTIYAGKAKNAEYPYVIICVNEKNSRGMFFCMKEENGVGVIGSQGYYEGGYPIDEVILRQFTFTEWE